MNKKGIIITSIVVVAIVIFGIIAYKNGLFGGSSSKENLINFGNESGGGSGIETGGGSGDSTGAEGSPGPVWSGTATEDMCIEYSARVFRGGELIGKGNLVAHDQIFEEIEALRKQYGLKTDADDEKFSDACNDFLVMDDTYSDRLYQRMRELGSSVGE